VLSARPAAPIHDRSKNVFPLPAGADTWVTRPARPSRSNNPRRDTIPSLTAGTGAPTLAGGGFKNMAAASAAADLIMSVSAPMSILIR
jgi:hypothetical protein